MLSMHHTHTYLRPPRIMLYHVSALCTQAGRALLRLRIVFAPRLVVSVQAGKREGLLFYFPDSTSQSPPKLNPVLRHFNPSGIEIQNQRVEISRKPSEM